MKKKNEGGISPLHKPTGKTHKIQSFEDLSNIITEENCDIVFANMFGSMKQFIELKKKFPTIIFTGFKWIDDGKLQVLKPELTPKKSK